MISVDEEEEGADDDEVVDDDGVVGVEERADWAIGPVGAMSSRMRLTRVWVLPVPAPASTTTFRDRSRTIASRAAPSANLSGFIAVLS